MKETLEEWIDELEEDPTTTEKRALINRLKLLLYKEKKSGEFKLDKPAWVKPSVRRIQPSRRRTG